MSYLQLIINPGSTSTKLALYDGAEKRLQSSIEHKPDQLLKYEKIGDQVPFRLALIRDFMKQNEIKGEELSAVVGRGGLVFGLKTGGYVVNDELCEALVNHEYSQPHASNLGGLLAKAVADEYGVPAYIYDAVTSGELSPVAQITGMEEIRRRSFCHVLNSRAQAIRYAASIGKRYEDLRLIVVHLGGGTSASVPCVVGSLAYLMSAKEGTSALEAEDLILLNSNDMGLPADDVEYGLGGVNVERALNADTPGIFDAAAADVAVVKNEAGNVENVVFTAQNRGTEEIERMVLVYTLKDALSGKTVDSGESVFENVPVGGSVSVVVGSDEELPPKLSASVEVRSADDANDHNNHVKRSFETVKAED